MRWTLVMSAIVPVYTFDLPEPTMEIVGDAIIKREVAVDGETRIFTHSIQRGTEVTVTKVIRSPGGVSYLMRWPSGLAVTSNAGGYTETHTIHVVAFDAAGNETESESVRVDVIHEREEEEEAPSRVGLVPLRRRRET